MISQYTKKIKEYGFLSMFFNNETWERDLIELGFSKEDLKKDRITYEDLTALSIDFSDNELLDKLEINFLKEIKLGGKIIEEVSLQDLEDMESRGLALSFDPINRVNKLVINDIKKILKKRSHINEMPLMLCSLKSYEDYYRKIKIIRYFLNENIVAKQQWINALFLCLLDAYNLEARELYLGFPDSRSYQYLIKNAKVEGRLDHRIIDNLVKMLDSSEDQKNIFKKIYPIGNGECFILESHNSKGVNIVFDRSDSDNLVIKESSNKLMTKKISPHVLLIDDDMGFVTLLKRVLSGHGFRVSVAYSVNDALLYHLTTESRIDLVITDLHLPKMGGVDLINAVRSRRADLPIIVLTSDEATNSSLQVIEAGGDILVRKNEDPKILLAWMKKILAKNFNSNLNISSGDNLCS